MKTLWAVLIAGLFAATASAKPCVQRVPFLLSEAGIGASIGGDAYTTAIAPRGTEANNVFLSAHPSNKSIALVSGLNFVGQSLLNLAACHVTHHVPIASSCTEHLDFRGHVREVCTEFGDDRLGWRIVGYTGILAETAILNGYFGAIHNNNLEAAHEAARRYTLK